CCPVTQTSFPARFGKALPESRIGHQLPAFLRAFFRTVPKDGLNILAIQIEVLGRAFGAKNASQVRDLERACGAQVAIAFRKQPQTDACTLHGFGVVVIGVETGSPPVRMQQWPIVSLVPSVAEDRERHAQFDQPAEEWPPLG